MIFLQVWVSQDDANEEGYEETAHEDHAKTRATQDKEEQNDHEVPYRNYKMTQMNDTRLQKNELVVF